MPIDITGPTPAQPRSTGESGSLRVIHNETRAAPKSDANPASGDTVRLTGIAALMQRLDAGISSLPVVDSQRVDALRTAIAGGNYDIDPARVAGKLIDREIALHGQGRN